MSEIKPCRPKWKGTLTDRERFNRNCERLEAQVRETLKRWGIAAKDIETITSVDMRYQGQKNTLEVEVGGRLTGQKQFDQLFLAGRHYAGALVGTGTQSTEATAEQAEALCADWAA